LPSLFAALTDWLSRTADEGLGMPLISEPGLPEANIGEAEGLYWPEVKSRFGEALTERWFTDDDAAFPGGETGLETRPRGLAALRRFVAEHPIGGSACRPTALWSGS
jgi:broad specificity phosphatase PhoE